MSETIISVKNLRLPFVYDSCVNLEVKRGEIISIYGDNGSGKTSLARYLTGLKRPEKMGQVMVAGMDLYKKENLCKLRRICSMVFQSPEEQLIYRQMKAELAFGPENLGVPSHEIADRIQKVISLMRLEKKEDIGQLSGGEKQRVALADILVMEPEILILDEAASMQEPGMRKIIYDAVCRWAKSKNRTVIFITHFEEELALSDRILEMKDGQLREVGPQEERVTFLPFLAGTEKLNGIRKDTFGGIVISEYTYGIDVYDEKEVIDYPGPKIRCENISFSYRDDEPLIENLTYSFRKGRLYVIKGETGVGKTTLAELLAGLRPVNSGQIRVDDMILPDKKKSRSRKFRKERRGFWKEIRRTVGYVVQYPERQLFGENGLDDIAYAQINMGLSYERAIGLARKTLEEINFEILNTIKRPGDLSGGERRSVAIAGILILKPDYLILDEPEAGLDEKGRRALEQVILHMLKQGRGVIVISHYCEPDSRRDSL